MCSVIWFTAFEFPRTHLETYNSRHIWWKTVQLIETNLPHQLYCKGLKNLGAFSHFLTFEHKFLEHLKKKVFHFGLISCKYNILQLTGEIAAHLSVPQPDECLCLPHGQELYLKSFTVTSYCLYRIYRIRMMKLMKLNLLFPH